MSTSPSSPQRPAFAAELVPALEMFRQAVGQLTMESLHDRRVMINGPVPGVPVTDLTVGGRVAVEERSVPGPVGDPDVSLLILRPVAAEAVLPGIYYAHAGGMILGTNTLGIESFLPYVADGKAVVVSVEYRLAPEHPDPAPVEDCYAGLVWTADHAAELGIDPGHLMVAGVSAGGGLAAGIALLARDRGYPDLSHQVLMCPMLDDRCTTESSRYEGDGTWDRSDNLLGWTALLGTRRGGEDVSHYAAPARCRDLSGLPTTYLDTGSAEVFRDEILDYAQRLSAAGVTVDLHMWGGGYHAFDVVVPQAPLSQAAVATRNEFFERALTVVELPAPSA